MYYNIISLRNRWVASGFLDAFKTPKHQIEMARYLEKTIRILISLDADDELPENHSGDLFLLSLVKLYKTLTIDNGFRKPPDIKIKLLSNTLKMEEHKINVNDLIDIGIEIFEKRYVTHMDNQDQINLDFDIRDEIVFTYLKKYGTR